MVTNENVIVSTLCTTLNQQFVLSVKEIDQNIKDKLLMLVCIEAYQKASVKLSVKQCLEINTVV